MVRIYMPLTKTEAELLDVRARANRRRLGDEAAFIVLQVLREDAPDKQEAIQHETPAPLPQSAGVSTEEATQ